MAMVNTSIKINEETKKETQKLFKDVLGEDYEG